MEITARTRLSKSQRNKNDEFYTLLEDIENEIKEYWKQLEGKKIWCNTDDPRWSNFAKFFEAQKYFHPSIEVKYTSYNLIPEDKKGYKKINIDKKFYKNKNSEIVSTNEIWVDEDGYCQGDFRAKEQEYLWKWADVIITNPPFSLFKEFIKKIIEEEKKFLIIGPQNFISYKETFHFIQENLVWLGINNHLRGMLKLNQNGELENLDKNNNISRSCTWFTNLNNWKRETNRYLGEWSDEKYLKYDNYDAYEIFHEYGKFRRAGKTNYPKTNKVLGVPITFLQKYNPNHFEILDLCNGGPIINPDYWGKNGPCSIKGKFTFSRIFIKIKEEYYESIK